MPLGLPPSLGFWALSPLPASCLLWASPNVELSSQGKSLFPGQIYYLLCAPPPTLTAPSSRHPQTPSFSSPPGPHCLPELGSKAKPTLSLTACFFPPRSPHPVPGAAGLVIRESLVWGLMVRHLSRHAAFSDSTCWSRTMETASWVTAQWMPGGFSNSRLSPGISRPPKQPFRGPSASFTPA